MTQVNFETPMLTGVQEYILRARQSTPGRDAIFLMMCCCLENRLPANLRGAETIAWISRQARSDDAVVTDRTRDRRGGSSDHERNIHAA